MDSKIIKGFSKLDKNEKLGWIVDNFFDGSKKVTDELKSFWHPDSEMQKVIDGFSENTISNFPMPFGIAPNFLINGKAYAIPMVIEESSVVAAASSAAKFWLTRGGFKTEILGTSKIGHLHFKWKGDFQKLSALTKKFESYLFEKIKSLTSNMQERGGGITKVLFKDFSHEIPDLRQLFIEVETCDSMGANFINSILEQASDVLEQFVLDEPSFEETEKDYQKIMAILSNYTPDCLVRATVSCSIDELGDLEGFSAEELAANFCTAVKIAKIDPYRASTHNKGIYNGVDAVVLATGNDFRAIEASGHTYASKDGQYRSLSSCSIEDGVFTFWVDLPLAVGTVGGLTNLHPIAKLSLQLLGSPSSEELMQIIAATGLAQNFAALRSLVTTGIQKGHMKMHLMNILNHQKASDDEMTQAVLHFENHTITFSAVRSFISSARVQSAQVPLSE